MPSLKTLAAIEYHGIAGATQDSVEGVQRLLLHKGDISKAKLLTDPVEQSHGFLLYSDIGDQFAVKTGFSSGCGGEGPRGLSLVLSLLRRHGVEIEEIDVDVDLLARLDASALTLADIKRIEAARAIRPTRFWDYIDQKDAEAASNGNPWRQVSPDMPLPLIDERLIDLALKFREEPDTALLKGYRRLENIIRDRIGLTKEEAAKGPSRVFASAFTGDAPVLTWPSITKGEQQGRANLFVGMVLTYRNVRAHQETDSYADDHLSEFLVLNHLYLLEAQAVPSTTSPTTVSEEDEA